MDMNCRSDESPAAAGGSSNDHWTPQCFWRETFRTLVAVGLTLATGGMILCVISLSGGTWWLDDFQSQWLPGYMDMNRALREGSFPLLSTGSWYGGDLSGEYQYGVFSIAHLAIVLLVFQWHLGFLGSVAALIATYGAILSSGVFRLGRRLGLNVPNATLASLATTLSGYTFFWGAQNWFPAFTSFAWLPWTWWAMEFALDIRRGFWRFLPAAAFLYLLIAAGWPFTVLMAAIVTFWLNVRNWAALRVKTWPLPASWGLALALASPAILALVEYHSFTVRDNTWTGVSLLWRVPVSAFGGMINPGMPAEWNHFDVEYQSDLGPDGLRHSCEVFCGLTPCVALLAMLFRRRTEFICRRRWELALLAFVAFLCHSGAAGAFRWSFRWLPLFHLCMALLGGFALQEWTSSNRPSKSGPRQLTQYPGFWSCLFVAAVFICVECILPSSVTPYFVTMSLALFVLSVAWLLGDRVMPFPSRGKMWLPVAITIVALIIGNIRPGQSMMHWPMTEALCEAEPLKLGRTYLAFVTRADVFAPEKDAAKNFRFGNTAMYAGLSFINGYSPMHPLQLARVLGPDEMGQRFADGERTLRNSIKPEGLLSQMGVDGLILGPSFAQFADLVLQSGWDEVGRYSQGILFHRPGEPAKRVRSLPAVVSVDLNGKPKTQEVRAIATIHNIQESRLSVSCHVENTSADDQALVAFSRAYYPGYRAFLNGVEVPIEAIAGIQPGVRIAPKAGGELLLAFRPKSVEYGLIIAATAVATAILTVVVSRVKNHGTNRRSALLRGARNVTP